MGKDFYKLIFKKNEFIFESNDNSKVVKYIDSRNKELRIVYHDTEKHISVQLNNETILNTTTNKKLNEYKVGMGFEGVGRWFIRFPYISIKTDEYFVNRL